MDEIVKKDIFDELREISSICETSQKKGLNYISSVYESNFESREWISKLPFISFPSDWEVQIIPPFCGAVVRFRVRKKTSKDYISVYFDGYDNLGFFGSPYWEIYPYREDTGRFALGEEAKMLEAIEEALSEPESKKE